MSIIFDPEVNDFGCYQARELSYLVDYIDARVFASLLAPVLMAAIFCIWHLLRRETGDSRACRRGPALVFALFLLMGLLDRQGFFYAAMGFGLLVMNAVFWRGGHGKTAIVMLLALAGQAAMLAMMIVRHPFVYEWVDHRLWYYPLPFQLMLLAGVTMIISVSLAGWSRWRRGLLYLLLAGAIVGNVVRWDTYRDSMLQSPWFPRIYFQSAIIKESLRQGRPLPYLDPEYQEFYDYCAERSPTIPPARRGGPRRPS